VTGQIDFHQLFDSLRRKFEDGVVGSNSCVVDEDTGSAELFSNLVCGSIDCVGIGNVAFDIMGDDYLSAFCLFREVRGGIKREVEPTHLTLIALVRARHPKSPP